MKPKIHVAVLMGGPTSEHEVSLNTGTVVINALDRDRYEIKPVCITRDGRWLVPSGYLAADAFPVEIPPAQAVSGVDGCVALECHQAPASLCQDGGAPVDVVFIAMHGPYGEDGTIQGMLDVLGLPYTGSGVLASALAMHKGLSRRLFLQAGLPLPRARELSRRQSAEERAALLAAALDDPGLPCVVKPASQGSSFGIGLCFSPEELPPAVDEAFRYDDDLLIEEYIEGLELTCPVLERPDNSTVPLPVIEIIPKRSRFFDYEAKYVAGATEEICPARIAPDIAAEVQRLSLAAHNLLGCAGLTRADFILRDGTPYLLEINTIPGMTQTSLAPQAARAAGMGFSELLDCLIECALRRGRRNRC